MAKKSTRYHGARAQPLFCLWNPLFSDCTIAIAVVVFLNSLIYDVQKLYWNPSELQMHWNKSVSLLLIALQLAYINYA